MSIGSLGIVAGLAGSQAAQRSTEVDQSQRDAESARARQTSLRAEQAAGIGQTEEDSQASDRDADGRRLWERPSSPEQQNAPAENQDATVPKLSKDPSGACGSELDLLG
jgi:hypothetical protein